MCRTACNVTGDCMVAAVVAHSESELLDEAEAKRMMAEQTEAALDEHPPDDHPPKYRQ